MNNSLFEKLRALPEWFRRKPFVEKIVVAAFVVGMIVYGGSKPATNAPAPRMMARIGAAAARGFTTNEIAAGVVRTYVRSNETWNFNPPPGATVIEKWRLRGAAYDWHRFECTNFAGVVFSDGRLRLQERQPCCHNSAPSAQEIATGCCATLAMTAVGSRFMVLGSSLTNQSPMTNDQPPITNHQPPTTNDQ